MLFLQAFQRVSQGCVATTRRHIDGGRDILLERPKARVKQLTTKHKFDCLDRLVGGQ
jgi:hypothetical protein